MTKTGETRLWKSFYFSPLGPIEISFTEDFLCGLNFVAEVKRKVDVPAIPLLRSIHEQLSQYFSGQRKNFSLPLQYKGTSFQMAVWAALLEIPYGETASYKEIAVKIGREKATRAVGAANRANPVSIIIPCHRVIGADGSLVGYGGELWRKAWLLEHEKKHKKLAENDSCL